MNKDQNVLHEQIQGIAGLKRELLLRLALFGHTRSQDPATAMMAEIRTINREIETVSKKLRKAKAGSSQEDAYLEQLKSLEDKRFQALSRMNGSNIRDYNTLQPKYR